MYTLAEDIERYKPVLFLNKILKRRLMGIFRITFLILAFVCAFIGLTLYLFISGPASLFFGLSLIFTGLWLEQILIYSYFNSFYFFGLNSIIGLSDEKISGATYEVAEALYKNEEDLTKSFCTSRLGTTVLLRAGVDINLLGDFLNSARPQINTRMVPLPDGQIFTLISLGKYLLQQDIAFAKMIQKQGVTDEIFFGALNWTISNYLDDKKGQRWWGKDNLSRTEGIGREWSYGVTYNLQKFSRPLNTGAVFSNLTNNTAFTEEKINEIEVSLARAKAANVLIIGEAGVGKIDLILEVNKRIHSGKSLSAIQGQQMILLDTSRLFSINKDKQSFELTLTTLFSEAIQAGNVIIVIQNLSTFVREAESIGVYLPEILDPYLATSALHVIATDTPGNYHTYLERLGGFARRFAEVLIDEPNLLNTIKVLENVAIQNENRYQTLFTYASLKAIAGAADRYLVEGVMPDKAIELLIDVATRANQSGTGIITEDYVYKIVSEKTGIPVGPMEEKERDLLLHLEDKLHERVIGQQRALDAIAGTMRRARAGIQAGDKPIGSFLFLGPTGVGKTETAKALAYIFFGDESKMHRLDMSEFSDDGAMSKLIGDDSQTGLLSDMLREHPYAVLLLDEFEKASKSIHDIFLQILDEGIFTDAHGEKVNARNTIIIATSNAGSDLIRRTIDQRKNLSILNQEIIDYIIKQGIYRPELINRFDNTIIFEPLNIEEQGQVANLMLKNLYERIKDKGYELKITRDLMDILVEKGYSPQFGARPMQRVIQDLIEEKIAQKMISGEIQKGDTVVLNKDDFSESELKS